MQSDPHEEDRFTNSLPSPATPANDGKPRRKLPRAAAKTTDESARSGSATKPKEAEREAGSASVSTVRPTQEDHLRPRKTRSLETTKNQRSGGWRGVYWNKRAKGWEVKVTAGEVKSDGRRRRLYIDTYKDPIEAAKAYDYHALRLLGRDTPLNFPDDRDELFDFVCIVCEVIERHDADAAWLNYREVVL